ncbi:MAG: hypothetical protein IPL54_07615 [Chitinophagaceae bacterium]|nr:hypothetical protein [Chitinophagaceae bacterium]
MAHHINESYYGKHFVWCSPVFNTEKLDSLSMFKKIPPSSNPYTIYQRLKQDCSNGDLHSSLITQNKSGLKRGAIEMLSNAVIDNLDFARINKIIDSATIEQFYPLLYLIPKTAVEKRVKLVDVNSMANPLSVEYQIEDLIKSEFEIIEP